MHEGENRKRRIGILSGGGDCPGTNAVIASVVKVGAVMNYELVGFERGLEGLLNPMAYSTLTVDSVKGISYLGGTILKTSNRGRFAGKVGDGDKAVIDPEVLQEAKNNLDSLQIEGLIVIGGDGTLSAAAQLADYGVNIIGIPKTIDNDLGYTDVTFGFSTAVDIVVDALDKVHTTATSHERTFIVECMGRSAGWITLAAGLAGGANAILLPEFEYSVDDLIDFMRRRLQNHSRSTVIVIAEGAKVDGHAIYSTGEQREVRYSGVSEVLMNAIAHRAPQEFDMRNVILGHTQRGGQPNAADRTLSKRYGVAAIEAYEAGRFGEMVCLVDNVMTTCPIRDATSKVKRVTEDAYECYVAQRLGIFLH
jgi:ATP-dependent phosphofructokinase / diphosphate-dependent phosphofructokinase